MERLHKELRPWNQRAKQIQKGFQCKHDRLPGRSLPRWIGVRRSDCRKIRLLYSTLPGVQLGQVERLWLLSGEVQRRKAESNQKTNRAKECRLVFWIVIGMQRKRIDDSWLRWQSGVGQKERVFKIPD